MNKIQIISQIVYVIQHQLFFNNYSTKMDTLSSKPKRAVGKILRIVDKLSVMKELTKQQFLHYLSHIRMEAQFLENWVSYYEETDGRVKNNQDVCKSDQIAHRMEALRKDLFRQDRIIQWCQKLELYKVNSNQVKKPNEKQQRLDQQKKQPVVDGKESLQSAVSCVKLSQQVQIGTGPVEQVNNQAQQQVVIQPLDLVQSVQETSTKPQLPQNIKKEDVKRDNEDEEQAEQTKMLSEWEKEQIKMDKKREKKQRQKMRRQQQKQQQQTQKTELMNKSMKKQQNQERKKKKSLLQEFTKNENNLEFLEEFIGQQKLYMAEEPLGDGQSYQIYPQGLNLHNEDSQSEEEYEKNQPFKINEEISLMIRGQGAQNRSTQNNTYVQDFQTWFQQKLNGIQQPKPKKRRGKRRARGKISEKSMR